MRPGTQSFQLVRRIEGTELTNSEVRRLCWGTAARVVALNPLTGVGVGCFGVAAEGLLPDGLRQVAASRGQTYRYAYNDYLQMGAELGLPALAAFVALLLAVLASARGSVLWRAADIQAEIPHLAAASGVAAALSALLAQALVDFPLHLPSQQTLFWVDLGLLGALTRSRNEGAGGSPARWTTASRLAAVVVALLAAAMVTTGAMAFLAERNAVSSVRLRESGRLEEALALAGRATALAPYEHGYWVILAEIAHGASVRGVASARTRELAFRAYRQAALTYPHHAPTYGRAGALYLSHAGAIPGAADSAEVNIRRAIALNPYYADPHTNLGTILMLAGDHGGARAEFLRAAELDTAAAAPFFNLGNLESAEGLTAEAEAHYRAALRREPAHFGALVNLSVLLIADDRLSEAEVHLRAALRVEPGSELATALLSTIEEAGR